jgi:hypothetical protein
MCNCRTKIEYNKTIMNQKMLPAPLVKKFTFLQKRHVFQSLNLIKIAMQRIYTHIYTIKAPNYTEMNT